MSAPAIQLQRETTAAGPERGCIALEGVCVSFPGNIAALHEVRLEIRPGTRLAVLGTSGSGKSTLLSVIAGRIKPSCGQVEVRGRIAAIHQDLRLVKQATALQNVLHGALGRHTLARTMWAFPVAEKARACALLERVGLAHRLHVPVGRLSGGEQQRVAIARALMQDPDILLADEPVASLDAGNAESIMRLLSDLQDERQFTLITVLHDRALAERFSDRLLWLDDGVLVEGGEAAPAPAIAGECEKECGPPLLQGFTPGQRLGLRAVAAGALLWALLAFDYADSSLDGLTGRMLEFSARLIPRSREQIGSIDWWALGRSLMATFQMVLVGTASAVLLSLPLAALAATNVGPGLVRPPVRALLNAIRAVPSIIWALLFVCAVGLGPVAGVLALVAYSIGYLTKFFYEAFESCEPGPQGALREIGASGPQRFVHAVWPASRVVVLSSVIFMLEYNVRAASVLGVVGAGGIGYELKLHVEYGNYHVVGAILLLLIVLVEVMDRLSRWLRGKMIA